LDEKIFFDPLKIKASDLAWEFRFIGAKTPSIRGKNKRPGTTSCQTPRLSTVL